MGDMKLFPRIDVVSYDGVSVTGAGSPWNVSAAPVENVQNDDLSRVARMQSLWWPRYYLNFDLSPDAAYTSVAFSEVEGLCVAGITGSAGLQGRVRYGTTPANFTQIIVPNSIEASTNVTASSSEMAKAPDAFVEQGGVWPTYTGTGNQDTSVRVGLTTPSGTISDANMPGGTHKVLVLVGLNSATSGPVLTVDLYDAGVFVKELGSTAILGGVGSTITEGGQLFQFDFADGDLGGPWSDAEIRVGVSGVGTYGMCAAVSLVVDSTTGVTYDSGYVEITPSALDISIGSNHDSTGDLRVPSNWYHVFPSTWTAGGSDMRVDFYDPDLGGGDYEANVTAADPWGTVDVGRVVLGRAETVTGGWRVAGGNALGTNDYSVVERGLGGLVFTQDRARARTVRYEVGGLTDAWRRNWATYYDQYKGLGKPLVVIPDASADQDSWFYDAIFGVQSAISPFEADYVNSTGTYWRKLLEIEELVSD